MHRESIFGQIVVAVLALAVLATLIDAAAWRRKPSPEPRLLTVTADAYQEAEPDVAKISLGVKAVRPTPKEAASSVAQTVKAIKARLVGMGVTPDAVDTSELYLGQATQYGPKKQRIGPPAYKAYHWLRVTLKGGNFDQLPDVVNAAVDAGATSFSGLVWEVKDETALRAAALHLATQRAMHKAKAMADAAGTGIAGIQGISDEYYGGYGYGGYAAAAGEAVGAAAASAEAPAGMAEVPGKLRISCHVKVNLLLR